MDILGSLLFLSIHLGYTTNCKELTNWVTLEENSELTLTCLLTTFPLSWTVVETGDVRGYDIAVCGPDWPGYECHLMTSSNALMYAVGFTYDTSSPSLPLPTSYLRIDHVDRRLRKVNCSNEPDTFNITNITPVVKPSDPQCHLEPRTLCDYSFSVTCTFTVLPWGRCQLKTEPLSVPAYTYNVTYRHSYSPPSGLYTTTCRVHSWDTGRTKCSNFSRLQVIVEPDVNTTQSLEVPSHWMSLEASEQIMTFTLNFMTGSIDVQRGLKVAFICYVTNATGVTLTLFRDSLILVQHKIIDLNKLYYEVNDAKCDDAGTYSCRADDPPHLEQKVKLSVKLCDNCRPNLTATAACIITPLGLLFIFCVIVTRIICNRRRRNARTIGREAREDQVNPTGDIVMSGHRLLEPSLTPVREQTSLPEFTSSFQPPPSYSEACLANLEHPPGLATLTPLPPPYSSAVPSGMLGPALRNQGEQPPDEEDQKQVRVNKNTSV